MSGIKKLRVATYLELTCAGRQELKVCGQGAHVRIHVEPYRVNQGYGLRIVCLECGKRL